MIEHMQHWNIWPIVWTITGITDPVRVDLEVMALEDYSTFAKTPELTFHLSNISTKIT